MNLNEGLNAATDHLAALARANDIGRKRWGAVIALRDAADALYDVAVRIAKGEPTKADKMGRDMVVSLHVANCKLWELDNRHGVRALTRVEWLAKRAGGVE